jgi:hypothetical protein
MRGLYPVVPLLMMATALSGCDLEFVDVDVDRPATFTATIYADPDSITLNASLDPGIDESHRVRVVVDGLLVDGERLEPDAITNQGQHWTLRLPASAAANGHLDLTFPGLAGLRAPREIRVPLPKPNGPNEIIANPGEPIPFDIDFGPVPSDSEWEITLNDANERRIYIARARHFPSGPILLPEWAIPPSPGPHEATLSIRAGWRESPQEGKYELVLSMRGVLRWTIHRAQDVMPSSRMSPSPSFFDAGLASMIVEPQPAADDSNGR